MSDDGTSRTLSADEVKRLSADPFAIFRTPTERDPRVDPRPGDKVRWADGTTVLVLGIGGYVCYIPWPARPGQQPSDGTLAHWRLLCQGAEVVGRG